MICQALNRRKNCFMNNYNKDNHGYLVIMYDLHNDDNIWEGY